MQSTSEQDTIDQEADFGSPVTPNPHYKPLKDRALLHRSSSFGSGPALVIIPNTNSMKESSSIRWLVLLLTCILLFGNYYAFDTPAALNIPLQKYLDHPYDTWQYELNMLYSLYSFPNMFIPIIGGNIIDANDRRLVLVILSIILCVGQTIFAFGVTVKNINMMFLGRILFGIGGECMSVIQASITTSWFKGKELAFALGMNICISRIGSVVNSNVSPRINNMFGGPLVAIWVGSLACYISFVGGLLLVGIMTLYSSEYKREFNNADAVESTPLLDTHDSDDSEIETVDVNTLQFFKPVQVAFMQSCSLPLSFWILCTVCILLYGTVIPFNTIASDFFMTKWYPGDIERAGMLMSIPDLLSSFLVPFLGYFVDSWGHRITLLILSSISIAIVHLTLAYSTLAPLSPMILLGISYGIYGVVVWPSISTVAYIQEQKLAKPGKPVRLIGTAFGISTAALNLSLTVLPMISAYLRVTYDSFTPVIVFFALLATVGFFMCVTLYIIDSHNDFILQKPESRILKTIITDQDRFTGNLGFSDISTTSISVLASSNHSVCDSETGDTQPNHEFILDLPQIIEENNTIPAADIFKPKPTKFEAEGYQAKVEVAPIQTDYGPSTSVHNGASSPKSYSRSIADAINSKSLNASQEFHVLGPSRLFAKSYEIAPLSEDESNEFDDKASIE